MVKRDLQNLFNAVKYFCEFKKVHETFDPFSLELSALFYHHYRLLEEIEQAGSHSDEIQIAAKFNCIIENICDSMSKLIDLISSLTKRKIVIHFIQEKDSLWKISREYGCVIDEIMQLNSLHNVFSLEGMKILLIPVKAA